MPRFYINQILIIDTELALPQNVVQHLNVIRLKIGDSIDLFNGHGSNFKAQLLTLDKKSAIAIIKEQNTTTPPLFPNVSLGISIIANDKMDLAIKNATELGVTNITPIISKYSQKIPPDRLLKRLEHWKNVIISSCEQCGQDVLPILDSPVDINDFVKRKIQHKVIFSLHNHTNIKTSAYKKLQDIDILIGPEGGLTNEEVEFAISNGYIVLKPWHNTLRTETAVTAGLSLFLNNLE